MRKYFFRFLLSLERRQFIFELLYEKLFKKYISHQKPKVHKAQKAQGAKAA